MFIIYDAQKKIVIIATKLSMTQEKNTKSVWGLAPKTIELKMLLDYSSSNWAVEWYQSQFLDEGQYQPNKRDVHVELYNTLFSGCYLKCYNRVSNSQTEVILGCDYTYYTENDDYYKKLYRDYKIENLLA